MKISCRCEKYSQNMYNKLIVFFLQMVSYVWLACHLIIGFFFIKLVTVQNLRMQYMSTLLLGYFVAVLSGLGMNNLGEGWAWGDLVIRGDYGVIVMELTW